MTPTKTVIAAVVIILSGWTQAPAIAAEWKGKSYYVPMEDANFSVAWWRSVGLNERAGFELATEQCLSHHLHKGIKRQEYSEISAQIDELAKAASDTSSVGVLLDRILSGNQSSLDKMDYDTWGPSDYKMHRGIVEGYIACSERHGDKLWYNTVEYYVSVLNLMYNTSLAYGVDQYQGLISDVLDRFGYKQPSPYWNSPSHKFKPAPEIDFDDDRPIQPPR